MRLKEEFVIGADRSSHASFEKGKRNQQCSLVEDEFKVVNKHPTGDSKQTNRAQVRLNVISPHEPYSQRNEGKGARCCLTQKKLRHMKQQPRASAKKGKTCGPESEPWRTPVKAASKKSCFSASSQILTNELNGDPTVI